MKKTTKVAVVAATLALIAGWVVGLGCYPFVMWSPLNCWHEDIDINSGRIRHQRFLLWFCVSERITDSPLSRKLQVVDVAADWRHANTFSPMVRYSPHYRFGATVTQTKELGVVFDETPFTPEAEQHICQTILGLWQSEQDYFAADSYIQSIYELAQKRGSNAEPLTLSELPKP